MREKKSQLFESRRHLLSPRENDVLDCILSGWLQKETAFELGMAEQTVKNHTRSIRRTLGIPKDVMFKIWVREQIAA